MNNYKLTDREIIKNIYDGIVKPTLNNKELTEKEISEIESKIKLSLQKEIYKINEASILGDLNNFHIKFIANLVIYIVKDHILENGNKRLALAFLIYLAKFKGDAIELTKLMRDIASDKLNFWNLFYRIHHHERNYYYQSKDGVDYDAEFKKAIEMLAKE